MQKQDVAVDFKPEEINDEFLTKVFEEQENKNQQERDRILEKASLGEPVEGVSVFNFLLDEFFADFTDLTQDKNEIQNRANMLGMASRGRFNVVIFGENSVLFKSDSEEIKAEILSKKIPDIKKHLPEIEGPERYRKCHYDAITTSLQCGNQHVIATGYISPLAKDDKYLHSWIEVKENDKEVVFDPSRNLIMDKDSYYKVRGVQEVHKISGEILERELSVINYLKDKNWLYIKLYLANRPLALQVCKRLLAEDKQKNEKE